MTWYESLLEPVLSIEAAERRFISALESLKKAVDGLARTLALTAAAASNSTALRVRGDGLGRMQTFTRTLACFTSTMAPDSTTVASGCADGLCENLARLVQTRARIRDLRRACDSLKPALRVQFLKPGARAATAAEGAGAPSIIALDALSIIEAETQLVTVVKHLDRTLTSLERVIRLAIDQQDSRILWTRTEADPE